MTDTTTQLAILSDALVKIIELGPMAVEGKASPADLLTRSGDIAAQALIAAATYGRLPPFSYRRVSSISPTTSRRQTR
ncbi:MAG: hypothetical protein WA156_17730 [Methylocystis silviterrae]